MATLKCTNATCTPDGKEIEVDLDIDESEILDQIADSLETSDLLAKIDKDTYVDEAIKYFGIDNILMEIPNDKILEYALSEGIIDEDESTDEEESNEK